MKPSVLICRGVLFFPYVVSSNELHQGLHCQDIPGKLENSGAQREGSNLNEWQA